MKLQRWLSLQRIEIGTDCWPRPSFPYAFDQAECERVFEASHADIFDNSAAASDLDFRYTIPWKEGIRRVVDWLGARSRIYDEDEPASYESLSTSWQTLGKRMAEVT